MENFLIFARKREDILKALAKGDDISHVTEYGVNIEAAQIELAQLFSDPNTKEKILALYCINTSGASP